MATVTLKLPPADGTPIKFTADLGGTLYQLKLNYNARLSYGTLDLSTAAGEPIIHGARAVVDYSLLAHCGHASKPDGILMLIDTAGTGIDPAYNEIGGRVALVYITPDT